MAFFIRVSLLVLTLGVPLPSALMSENFGNPVKMAEEFVVTERLTEEEVVQSILDGKFGNGAERRKKVESLGFSYSSIQEKVNESLSAKKSTSMITTANYEQVSYEEPQGTYEGTQSTYEEPQDTYEETQSTYEEPQGTYEETQSTYEEPQGTYEETQSTYEEPVYSEPYYEPYTIQVGSGSPVYMVYHGGGGSDDAAGAERYMDYYPYNWIQYTPSTFRVGGNNNILLIRHWNLGGSEVWYADTLRITDGAGVTGYYYLYAVSNDCYENYSEITNLYFPNLRGGGEGNDDVFVQTCNSGGSSNGMRVYQFKRYK